MFLFSAALHSRRRLCLSHFLQVGAGVKRQGREPNHLPSLVRRLRMRGSIFPLTVKVLSSSVSAKTSVSEHFAPLNI